MNYRGAVFDVDGVLVDTPHEAAWRESLRRLMEGPWRDLVPASAYSPEGFTTAFYLAHLAGRPRLDGAAAALAAFGVADPDGQRAGRYAEAKQAMIEELIVQGAFAPFDDGLRLLARLWERGVRLAAASSSRNANAFLARIPARPGATMLDLFDANLCGQERGRGKPFPDIFLAAAAALSLPPAECFVVEDAVAGVRAARAAGMDCVAVARLGDAPQLAAAGATTVVTSLDEVAP